MRSDGIMGTFLEIGEGEQASKPRAPLARARGLSAPTPVASCASVRGGRRVTEG